MDIQGQSFRVGIIIRQIQNFILGIQTSDVHFVQGRAMAAQMYHRNTLSADVQQPYWTKKMCQNLKMKITNIYQIIYMSKKMKPGTKESTTVKHF